MSFVVPQLATHFLDALVIATQLMVTEPIAFGITFLSITVAWW